jgi:GxxExxY protein
MSREWYNTVCDSIIGGAIEVHRCLGPGLLESVYEACLIKELTSRGLLVENQVTLPVVYKGEVLDKFFVIDILVNESIIVELKAVENILKVHEVQLLTYLKLSNKKLGLLINFNVPLLKDGIRRRINGEL